MSQSQTQYTDPQQQQHGGAQDPASKPYVFTEEERRVLQECRREALYYRSLPFATVTMTVTQLLVLRGVLAPSPRLGSLPKVAFAGLIGYIGGQLSYQKTCHEKFKNLENSPFGEALRQGRGLPQQFAPQRQPEMSDPSQTMYEPAVHSVAEPHSCADSFSYPDDFPSDSSSSSAFSESAPMVAGDDFNLQAPAYLDNETPQKKPMLYEDLRTKNRENYEVVSTQKTETMFKPSAEVDVKKNKYGDAWDE